MKYICDISESILLPQKSVIKRIVNMTAQDSSLFRLYFKLAIYQKSGMAFQEFFAKVMIYSDSGFEPVKPYGNWGDGGNDGHNPGTKHYYQVYAPVATTKMNAQEALKKSTTDYHKLLKKWGAVNGYSFVVNDRFTGVEAPLSQAFWSFKADKNISNGEIVHTLSLQKIFMTLAEDDKLEVLDMHCLAPSDSSFEPTIISDLVKYLLNEPDVSMNLLASKAPDFSEKIKFNNISENLETRIKNHSLEVYKIDDFLIEQNDDSIAQELSQTVNNIYKQLVVSIPNDEEYKNEIIYLGLVESLIPKFARDKAHAKRGYNTVAEIIISKYFETCDAYEDPNSSNSS